MAIDEAVVRPASPRACATSGRLRRPGPVHRAARRRSRGATTPASSTSRSRPSCSTTVVEGLGSSGLNERRPGRRGEAVRPRPGLGPRAQRSCTRSSPRARSSASTTSSEGVGAEPARLPLRQLVPRADLEPQLRRQRADHHGRGLRRRGPGRVLRRGGRAPRRRAEPPAADRRLLAMEPPVGAGRRRRSATRGQGHDGDAHPRRRTTSCAASTPAIATRTASRRTRTSRPSCALRFEIDSWRWAGVPFFIRAGKPGRTLTEAVVEFRRPPRLLFARRPAAPGAQPAALPPEADDRITLAMQAKRPGERP